jgi:hypothetical protein
MSGTTSNLQDWQEAKEAVRLLNATLDTVERQLSGQTKQPAFEDIFGSSPFGDVFKGGKS